MEMQPRIGAPGGPKWTKVGGKPNKCLIAICTRQVEGGEQKGVTYAHDLLPHINQIGGKKKLQLEGKQDTGRPGSLWVIISPGRNLWATHGVVIVELVQLEEHRHHCY
ncbi:GM17491 [Drosophila sechellia]|uniref:GM17491 n=1 Tax=Drosophila sechellia TaxID=7238 RepID=B4IHH5_DROSE|nr:GM17491 [Drosophila sechellia]